MTTATKAPAKAAYQAPLSTIAQVLRVTEPALYRRRGFTPHSDVVDLRQLRSWAYQMLTTASPAQYADITNTPTAEVYNSIRYGRLITIPVAGVDRVVLPGVDPTQAEIDVQLLRPRPDDSPESLYNRNRALCSAMSLMLTGPFSSTSRARLQEAIDLVAAQAPSVPVATFARIAGISRANAYNRVADGTISSPILMHTARTAARGRLITVTVNEMAERVGVSVRHLRRQIVSGKFATCDVAGSPRVIDPEVSEPTQAEIDARVLGAEASDTPEALFERTQSLIPAVLGMEAILDEKMITRLSEAIAALATKPQ